jgi:hypothetical protein
MVTTNLNYMLITANPEIAQYAEQAGVHRIFIDMEVMGKFERQGHLNTHRACHTFTDISNVRSVLARAELMVRLNPLYDGSANEVDQALAHGAQRLMLPMFRSRGEVCHFLDLVDGRAPVTFLTETPQAFARLPSYLNDLGPEDHIHIGLNDLSLGMGLDFLFEPVAAGLLDPMAALFRKKNITWGFGGIARIGTGTLPAELVLNEHIRLGSTWVILSRAFHQNSYTLEELKQQINLPAELDRLTTAAASLQIAQQDTVAKNHHQFVTKTFELVANKNLVA